ncbi:hypothetical protein ACOACO_17545 [Nocardioides sp. CPCC 205120]|uniref:hypothetical protein n=1 Tax=Nocardioides sp. CPCC 205120 TaxID=3406462 RepID=UPI003B5053C8
MAKPEREVSLTRKEAADLHRYKVFTDAEHKQQMIQWAGRVAVALALAVPLWVLGFLVEDLAGKNTDVTISMTITIAISVVIGGAYWNQVRKNKAQATELTRLRGRLEQIDSGRSGTSPTSS